jgi:hypothetical protein
MVGSPHYLDQLAEQLKSGKSAACRRAIGRILAMMKKRYDNGEFASPREAEVEFRKFVERQGTCQKGEKTVA